MCNTDCIYGNRKISTIYSLLLQIMHLFVALILTNDDLFVFSASSTSSSSSLSSSANESHANQSTTKSPSSRKFNLHTFLEEKLLEPYIQKIYGKCTQSRLECLLAPSISCFCLCNTVVAIDLFLRSVVHTVRNQNETRIHLPANFICIKRTSSPIERTD